MCAPDRGVNKHKSYKFKSFNSLNNDLRAYSCNDEFKKWSQSLLKQKQCVNTCQAGSGTNIVK